MSIAYTAGMSPAPARTSTDAIVAAARRILEADGLSAVTMRSVGEAVGVRGPSLYKRVPDRAALLRAVADAVVADLAITLSKASAHRDPGRNLRRVAIEYRAFVRANPNGYQLLFSALPAGASPDPATLASLGEPIVRAMAGLAGEPVALEGARTMVAWAHGFVSMELAGGFRLGGDLDAAYAFGIEAILAGISAAAIPGSR
jgi:AcrR family transcriptional regulator